MRRLNIFEKEKLGRTFQYYRNKNNIKWENIIKQSNISKNNYSKMSQGYIYKYDTSYIEFLRFFGLTFRRKENFEIWLKTNLPILKDILERFDIANIEAFNEEFHKELDRYKQFPIYEQYYFVFEQLFKYYYKNDYLTEKEIETDIILIKSGFLEKELVVFLLEIMYVSNNNNIGNDILRNKIINIVNNYENEPVLFYIKAINEKCENKLKNALDIFDESFSYWKDKNCHYREIKSLNGKFMIYQNIDDSKAAIVSDELLKYKEYSGIPTTLKNSINYNIGMYHFMNKRYEDAFPLFLENVDKYNGIKEMIFIGSISTHLDKELPDCFLTVDYSNSSYKTYIDFYKMKKEGATNKELENQIMYVILYEKLIHNEYVQPMWRIYEYELYSLLKTSRKVYNSYIKYKEMLEKICKIV